MTTTVALVAYAIGEPITDQFGDVITDQFGDVITVDTAWTVRSTTVKKVSD